MAVYKELSTEEMVDLLTDYDLGMLESFAGIASGVENTNYWLQTGTGRYILTIFEKRVNQDDLPFFLDLKKHLAGKGLPVAQPVPAGDGTVLRTIRARQGAIFTFLEGREADAITSRDCAEVGQILGKLHIAGLDFPRLRENDFSVASFPEILATCVPDLEFILPGLRQELDCEIQWLAQSWPTSLPVGTIHADLFPDNLLFQDGKVGGVIDFYFACRDFLAYDLAVCISAWCFDANNQFCLSHARAMVEAYMPERSLEEGEKSAMPILLRGCCLRFTLTRLTDFFATAAATGKAKDPTEFHQRLRFFRENPALDIF